MKKFPLNLRSKRWLRIVFLVSLAPAAYSYPAWACIVAAVFLAATHVVCPGEGDGLALAVVFLTCLAGRDLLGDIFHLLVPAVCLGGVGAYFWKHRDTLLNRT
ncbi:hypothetical protein [Methanopyrus sp.]